MLIPVVLKNKKELSVSKDNLSLLLINEQIMSFKRSDGWVVVDHDKVRGGTVPYQGEERRNHEIYSKTYWY